MLSYQMFFHLTIVDKWKSMFDFVCLHRPQKSNNKHKKPRRLLSKKVKRLFHFVGVVVIGHEGSDFYLG